MKPAYKRAALGAVVAMAMLGVVPGVAFAAQPSCGDTIMTNVTLTADLDCSGYGGNGITFGKKGLTLNLNGHTIWGTDGDDSNYGVYTNYKKNVTVKNGTLDGWGNAVYADSTVGGTYKNLKLRDTANDEPLDEGIYIYEGANNLVTNNNSDGVGYGIDVEYSAGNWITNNTVKNAYDGVYLYYEQSDHVSGNTAMGYSDVGFNDYESGDNVYNNNHADADGDGGGYGFYLECDGYGWVTVTNNTATDNSSYGFEIYECYDDYAYNSFQNSVISGNVSNDNSGYGFYDYYSLQAKYTNNTAKRNGSYGFYLDYPGGLTVTGNVANDNDSDGIYMDDMGYGNYGNPKVVSNNTANGNTGYGIYADYGVANASGNQAHNNSNAPDDCWNIACN
jgi:parallel beta-helix repeat protein